MSGKRRKALERAFRELHQGKDVPRTTWDPKDETGVSKGCMRSMHRGLKKHPERFGIGLQGAALTAVKVGVVRALHARDGTTELTNIMAEEKRPERA